MSHIELSHEKLLRIVYHPLIHLFPLFLCTGPSLLIKLRGMSEIAAIDNLLLKVR